MSAVTATAVGASPQLARARVHDDRLLILVTSLLIDRMLLHTEALPQLAARADVTLWSSNRTAERSPLPAPVGLEPFPQVLPFPEPYNYLRRVNEFAWDAALKIPSRTSIDTHTRRYRASIRALRTPARMLAAAGLTGAFERAVERTLLTCTRSPEAIERLRRDRPSVLLATGPFQYEQPAVVAAARALGIPVLAMIPSWDNLSTKNRMVFRYDGYVVWSTWMAAELAEYYPQSRSVPVYVVGAPQFDVFYAERFRVTREAFCQSEGLDPRRPIVVYALGSPNFLQEVPGAVALAQRMAAGALGDAQLLVRPHPMFDNRELLDTFRPFGPSVVVQQTGDPNTPLVARAQDAAHVVQWVNTFRHANVVVNLSSTVAVDAAICDVPVVNLDYDPSPGQPRQQLVKEINHQWNHFKPIAESGGLWLANDGDEVVRAVATYLEQPELHREERRWVAARVCEHLDGRCGIRLADALLDFASRHRSATAI